METPQNGKRRRRWTKEAIIDAIRDLHAEGAPLTTRAMAKRGLSGMVTTAYKPEFFGSWSAALEAASVDAPGKAHRPRKWTRERVIQRIRELHRQGCDLCHSSAKREHQYLVVVASDERMFGSWRDAVEAAGLPYDSVSKHEAWTKEKIISRIRLLHRRGEPLSHESARQRHGALVSAASSPRYFGSWERAIRAAGLSYDSIRRIESWNRARILEKIRELHAQGVALNNASMRRLGYRGMMEAAARPQNFGSWEAAVRAAGIDYDRVRLV